MRFEFEATEGYEVSTVRGSRWVPTLHFRLPIAN